jgi:hypothetical protein
MTTDLLAAVLFALSVLAVLVGLWGLRRQRRQLAREMTTYARTAPTSLEDWRQRAEESQRRSDARRGR